MSMVSSMDPIDEMFEEINGGRNDIETDYGLNEMRLIEEEYLDMKRISNEKIEEEMSLEEAKKELTERLAKLKKQLKSCRNIKNANKTKQNTEISKKRALLRTQIQQLSALIEMANDKNNSRSLSDDQRSGSHWVSGDLK